MPRIPDEAVEQVLAATDIVELIGSYFPLKRAGSLYKALCPFHNEKTPSFTINPARQTFKCFGCNEGGTAAGFVMKYDRLPFPDALRKLASRANITIEEAEYDPEADRSRRRRSRLIELHNATARFLLKLLLEDPAAQHARDYLKSRGYGREMAERWTVGWIPRDPQVFLNWAREKGFSGRELMGSGLASLREENNPQSGLYLRFRDRLMFPIHSDFGEVIAFSGRQLREDPNSGKYINSPETPLFTKSKVFFGLDKARRHVTKAKFALLCEGQMDVIACHEAEFENAVASLGTAFTSQHAHLLKRYTDEVVICYDSDSAGRKATEDAFRELATAGLRVKVASLPAGQDPDSFVKSEGATAFRQHLEQAAEFFDYKIESEQAAHDLRLPGQLSQTAARLASLVATLNDAVARDAVINYVAMRIGIGTPEFREAVNQAQRSPQRVYRGREDPEQDQAVEPTTISPELGRLCQLALRDHRVLDWLCDQTEVLLSAMEGRPGEALLRRILTKRPDPENAARVNTFLSSLPAGDEACLLNLLEERLPEDPLRDAEETLSVLTTSALQRKISAIQAELRNRQLSEEEVMQRLEEVKELQSFQSEAKKP